MRRFVQALSAGVELPTTLPSALGDSFLALPDRYNISIRQTAGVVRQLEGGWDVSELQWGLIPAWEPQATTRYSTQTARLERAAKSRMYRKAWESRHCLVPMTGYYKWERSSTPRKPLTRDIRCVGELAGLAPVHWQQMYLFANVATLGQKS